MRPRRTVIVFVKEPRPGRVKTRLARGIGAGPAAWWFRRSALGLIGRLARDPRWRVVLAVSPDREGLESRVWPARSRVARAPQGRGDLGARMARALRAAPPGPAVLIGADIPDADAAAVARAFAALGRAEAVFGPTEDGGFWLVGLSGRRPPPPGFLRGARWSSPHALADAVATCGPLRVAFAPTLRDVDEAADLAAIGGRAGRVAMRRAAAG